MGHDSAGDKTVGAAAAASDEQAAVEAAVEAPVQPPSNGRKNEMRVSASSNPASLASAISYSIYDGKKVTLRAIGHGAIGQCMKSIAIARSFVAPRGFDIAAVPGFVTAEGNFGDTVSAMTFRIVVLD